MVQLFAALLHLVWPKFFVIVFSSETMAIPKISVAIGNWNLQTSQLVKHQMGLQLKDLKERTREELPSMWWQLATTQPFSAHLANII
jgi:hypothetical protein